MPKKVHVFPSHMITRSVLDGIPITALCGEVRTITRKSFNKAASGNLPKCSACLDAFGELTRHEDALLRKREGWTAHLEREVRESPRTHWKITTTRGPVTWSADFPLAG